MAHTIPAQNNKRTWLTCILLAALTWIVFGQGVGHSFVELDDGLIVTENPRVTNGLTLKGIADGFASFDNQFYTPLRVISHMLDWQLYGANAGGHHLTNILLHTVSTLLLFAALKSMTGSHWRSAFVAAVFAVHPLHVESVAWISERKDTLSGVFFMLALLAYSGFVRKPTSIGRYILVLVFFLLGLMSKPSLVTFPFVLLLLDYWPLGRFTKANRNRLILEKIPLLILSASASFIAFAAQGEVVRSVATLSMPVRAMNAMASYGVYLRQTIYPAGLVPYYPHPGTAVSILSASLIFAVLLSSSVCFFFLRRSCPYLLVGWLWFLGMLTPMIGIIQVGDFAHADRFMYLAQVGLILMVAWAAGDLCSTWPKLRGFVFALAAGATVALALCSFDQTKHWRSSETLWRHALEVDSNNYMAHSGLGNALLAEGRPEEAITCYQAAMRIKPDFIEAWNYLGNAFLRTGQADQSIATLQTVLAIKPDFALAQNNLGNAYFYKGQFEDAIVQYRKAISLAPGAPSFYNNLGGTLLEIGKLDEAIPELQKALEIDSNCWEACRNMGKVFLQKGLWNEAVVYYSKAISIQPSCTECYYDLGTAHFKKSEIDQAIASYTEAVKLNPQYSGAWFSLGNSYARKGQTLGSISSYEKAIACNPRYTEAYSNLGNLLLQTGNATQGIHYLERALEIDPTNFATSNRNGLFSLYSLRSDCRI